MDLTKNLILNTDSYKASHWLQYPPKTKNVFSYIESRGGEYPWTVFYGLQIFLKEYLSTPITAEMIDDAELFWKAHGEPFNREGWEYILKEHNGYLPLRIRAVPEGTVVPTSNVLVTVEATDPNCYWLVSYMETGLMRAAWYGTTVATNSYNIKRIIKKYLEETGDPNLLPFKFHDFGARGATSFEQAGIGGSAHLINFMGTDTVTGALYAMKYYGGELPVGFSIPAAEHSTMTSWGGRDGEVKAMENMLDKFGGEGKLVAVVSDSYDIYRAITELWGIKLKDKILKTGGTLVVRPDSGDPVEVTLKCVDLLGEAFGFTVNEKGFKVLNPAVRLIQGDGITGDEIEKILASYKANGWSADNIAFGCGAGLLQKLDRDTLKFAMKASAIELEGEGWIDVFKDPITDSGKRSKKGRVTLYKDKAEGFYYTDREIDFSGKKDELITVFENGKVVKEWTFAEVRTNSEK
ncbi:MAG: nicotinate phosphoribosyltransferase [Candidatus Thorarchaeota archaeon]|nr:MAG: nicotinate phosphoribosyltransferase [Candidatus Thorarchaeota archaeon]